MKLKDYTLPLLSLFTFLVGLAFKFFSTKIYLIFYVNLFFTLSIVFSIIHLYKNIFENNFKNYTKLGFKLSLGKFLGFLGFTLTGIGFKNKILD